MTTILIVSLLVVAFLFIQLFPFIKAREMRGRQVSGLSDVLSEQQLQQKRLLFYFWSPRCSMCRTMTPVIEQLSRQRGDVISVNAAEDMELAKRFKIIATPTMVLVVDGKVDKVLLGAKSEKTIHSLLK